MYFSTCRLCSTTVQMLVEMRYSGYYSFEWEKVWHPEIEDPEIAVADYARVVTQYLKDAHFKSAGRGLGAWPHTLAGFREVRTG
jgi:hypothetical protein